MPESIWHRVFGRGADPGRDSLAAVESELGVRFSRRELLEGALTHRSFAHEQGLDTSYERMEFLGDAVLGLAAAEWLFERFPDLEEGPLTELNSYLVSRASLAACAREIDLGRALRLGVGEERSGGRSKSSLLADALEAVLGAVFLDQGYEQVRRIARPMFERSLDRRAEAEVRDAKTRLQESVQARGLELPDYQVVEESGPDHRKRFAVECRVADEVWGRGEGRSKKVAEQRAAAEALQGLDGEGAADRPAG